MGRVAAVDFGLKRLGIAVSDERKMLASPFETLQAKKSMAETAKALFDLLQTKGPIDAIILGLPLLLSGKEGEMVAQVKLFAHLLKEYYTGPIIFWDERLTTAQAERSLKEMDMNRKKRAKYTDLLAATLILQTYLDSQFPI